MEPKFEEVVSIGTRITSLTLTLYTARLDADGIECVEGPSSHLGIRYQHSGISGGLDDQPSLPRAKMDTFSSCGCKACNKVEPTQKTRIGTTARDSSELCSRSQRPRPAILARRRFGGAT